MTIAMWLAWLLREDVRAGAPVFHAEMQREFVVWWLIWGRAAFPGAWWYGPTQLAVAMEPVETERGTVLPRLLRQIYRARPDLAETFPLADTEGVAEVLCWYRLRAPHELATAPALPHESMLETERPGRRLPWNEAGTLVPRMAVVMHRVDPTLQMSFEPRDPAARRALADWYAKTGRGSLLALQSPPDWPEILPPPRPAPARGATVGLNIVGYTRQPSGIGEDARMFATALKESAIPRTLVNIAAEPAAAAPLARRLRYPVTVLCLSAFDTARLFLEQGPRPFAVGRTIGAWPWELAHFPAAWTDVLALVDEIWAASRFTADAFVAAGATRVRHLPPAVMVTKSRPALRGEGALPPPGIFTFIYPFDPKSFLSRKNPVAAVRAFRQAFSADDHSVALLLRLNGDPPTSRAWMDVLAARAEDRRVICDAAVLPRPHALAVLAACDCLISTHRAEGFGRNIAEAILLGLPVLSTGYSGCVDFLLPRERVRWTERRVLIGEYPFGDGASWAEVRIDHLAERMQQVRRSASSAAARAARQRRAAVFAAFHTPAAAGRRYAAALRGRPSAYAGEVQSPRATLHADAGPEEG
jgi:glycosyltransferase involved in cell wall biosynthesis